VRERTGEEDIEMFWNEVERGRESVGDWDRELVELACESEVEEPEKEQEE
jgi:hypothetical protein